MILSLDFKFDAAHRLMEHKGLCFNLHGHTWKVQVQIEGTVDEQTGMIVDFAKVREQIDNYVISFLDHSMLVNTKDYDVKAFLNGQDFRYVEVTAGDPTCENLAEMLYQQINLAIFQEVISIQVWETEKSSAIYKRTK